MSHGPIQRGKLFESSEEARGLYLLSIVQNNMFSNLLPAPILLLTSGEVKLKNLVSGSKFLRKEPFLFFAFGLDIFPIKFHHPREKRDLKTLLKTKNIMIWIANQ